MVQAEIVNMAIEADDVQLFQLCCVTIVGGGTLVAVVSQESARTIRPKSRFLARLKIWDTIVFVSTEREK
jgi:hypothetical protein